MGVSIHVEQFEEYKSAGETFSKDKFSQPAKEEIAVILNARAQRMYQLIATGRNIPIRTIQEAFDREYMHQILYLAFILLMELLKNQK